MRAFEGIWSQGALRQSHWNPHRRGQCSARRCPCHCKFLELFLLFSCISFGSCLLVRRFLTEWAVNGGNTYVWISVAVILALCFVCADFFEWCWFFWWILGLICGGGFVNWKKMSMFFSPLKFRKIAILIQNQISRASHLNTNDVE